MDQKCELCENNYCKMVIFRERTVFLCCSCMRAAPQKAILVINCADDLGNFIACNHIITDSRQENSCI